MGGVRTLFGSSFVALAIFACSSAGTGDPATSDDADTEPARVPDPPPRYKPLQITDAAPFEGDGSSELVIKCGREKPYVCPLEDGTFACSSVPCLPDCTRIGCLGAEVCKACDGGYRCVDPASACQ
jgi:hypothetical protein